MAVTITHAFVSSKDDGTKSALVQPSDWNADHQFTMADSRILGRLTAATGAVEELDLSDIWTLLGIVAGTAMIFVQTTPPTGWTKQTTHNNKALRLVSGTASSGGSGNFTTIFANVTSGGTALTSATIPAHTHSFSCVVASGGSHYHTYDGLVERTNHPKSPNNGSNGWGAASGASATTGSGGAHSHTLSGTTDLVGSETAHTHTLNMAVQYVDAIYAEKAA